MLILGEVHTGLLQHSTSLTQPEYTRLLALFRGERVRRFARPIEYAVSPDLLTGVDCRLPVGTGARVRAVGTVVSRAAVTGGRVLQGSATLQLTAGAAGRRLAWSHYLSRPGCLEILGKADPADVVTGFLGTRSGPATLDLSAIAGRVMDTVQSSPRLDHDPPFRAGRTCLRWAATDEQAGLAIRFGLDDERRRTVALTCGPDQAAAVQDLCEDLALHDWLLSTLLEVIAGSRLDGGPAERREHGLRQAVDHLLHLWMPAARVAPELTALWECLERRPGFSRQWQSSVNRIRDQLALSTIALLSKGFRGGVPAAGPAPSPSSEARGVYESSR